MIISSLERPRSRPVLEQENREVLRIGSYFGIEFGHRDVSDFDLLPSLFLIRLEYFVERLIKGSSLVRYHYRDRGISGIRRYLVVPSNAEGTVFQLFGGKVRQHIGNISGNIGSGSELNLLVAIATNGHFPAWDINVPLDL